MAAKSRTAPASVPARAERQKLAAVDFYSALQRALDAMQRQLSHANNASADFVVKEFKVDAAVQMQINPFGVLQFALADDTTAPESISRVSLTLAAVAKPVDPPMSQNLGPADATALADVPWLPAGLAAQLGRYEVRTVAEFLGVAADARLTTQVASLVKRERADVRRWADRMRLLTLPSMTVPHTEMLGKHGIQSVPHLARMSEEAFAELQRKMASSVSAERLALWREAAERSVSSPA